MNLEKFKGLSRDELRDIQRVYGALALLGLSDSAVLELANIERISRDCRELKAQVAELRRQVDELQSQVTNLYSEGSARNIEAIFNQGAQRLRDGRSD